VHVAIVRTQHRNARKVSAAGLRVRVNGKRRCGEKRGTQRPVRAARHDRMLANGDTAICDTEASISAIVPPPACERGGRDA